jgi:hypothetical protein
MDLEPEQDELLARMVEGARSVPRADREWLLMSYGGGSFLQGPGIGRADVPDGDVYMLERAGYIHAVRYSPRDSNPTFVITPEGRDRYAKTRGREPVARQEGELRRFLDGETFRAGYPEAYAKWTEADALLWRADSEREFTTVGHKVREALQHFATEAVDRYRPSEVETNPALVNKRLGAVIAKLLPGLGDARGDLLKALGDYSEAALNLTQRQEHGAMKEGDDLTWNDARRVVFHTGSVMYEFAEAFREAATP